MWVKQLLVVYAYWSSGEWIDSRDDIFPSDLLQQVQCITTDTLDAEIEQFDRSGAILILTHDHQLDLQLCFTALKPTAKPFAYVGMIGSKSKRAILKSVCKYVVIPQKHYNIWFARSG